MFLVIKLRFNLEKNANKSGMGCVQEWDGCEQEQDGAYKNGMGCVQLLSRRVRSLDVLLHCILVGVNLRELPHAWGVHLSTQCSSGRGCLQYNPLWLPWRVGWVYETQGGFCKEMIARTVSETRQLRRSTHALGGLKILRSAWVQGWLGGASVRFRSRSTSFCSCESETEINSEYMHLQLGLALRE